MRIALLAPFEEPVPPLKYGGTERVVYNTAEELVALGHEVTLLATQNSKTSAKLVGCAPRPTRSHKNASDNYFRAALNLHALSEALAYIQTHKFDIIHNHFGWQALMFQSFVKPPIITTIHGTLDKKLEPTEHYIHNQFSDSYFVSISNSQRKHSPRLNYVSTVYNGIRPERFSFSDKTDDYYAFLGRIHPQKGPRQAIEIAKKAKIRLVMAAKIDPKEREYFKREIKPHIDGKQIVFLGEVNHAEKVKLLRRAKALISPIQWDEPFGIANIESLACGTPVISLKRGSLCEIINDGVTGYCCDTTSEMIKRIRDIGNIDRAKCRKHVEQFFTASHMADGYLTAYKTVIAEHKRKKMNLKYALS